jgi:diguanylate cyclase (GGDEF)-like protein
LAHRGNVTAASSQLEPAPASALAINSLRHNARLITVPRLASAAIVGLSPFLDPSTFAMTPAFIGAAVLLLTNALVLGSERFNDKQARQAVALSVALDFLVLTTVITNLDYALAAWVYMGSIIIGIEAGLLFYTRGFLAFLGVFAVVGWVPLQVHNWLGHEIPVVQFFIQSVGVAIGSWAVARAAEQSERRQQEAAYLARVNEALALVAQNLMVAPQCDQVIAALSATLSGLKLPWTFSVLVRQSDDALHGPHQSVVDAKAVRQHWKGADPVVRNPEFLTPDLMASIFGQTPAKACDNALVRCQLANELVAAVVVSGNAGNAFAKVDTAFLTTLANQAGAALERAALLEHVEELALTDALTQLHNRRAFDERLAEEMMRADRNGQPLALVMLDVDHFKLLNDTQGHSAGDRTLSQIGEILRSLALKRPIDLSYRLGGEEFAVLLPGTPLNGAMVVAERLRAEVGETNFPDAKEQPLGRLTISVGVAVHIPGSGHSATALIESSDLALYEAKRAGRDCVRSAPPLKSASSNSSVAG